MSQDDTLSILIVDDSDFFVSFLADRLESTYGMATKTATDADEAISALKDGSIDCVVSDYQMPRTSGLELFEMIETRHDVPFILLTAQGGEEIASQAIRMGIDDYLLKRSIREDEQLDLLVNRIQNVVEQHRIRRKYERLVDNSPDVIGQINLDGEILAANETMATAFGVSQAEVIGQRLSAFIPEEVANKRLEEAKRAITAGSAVTFEDSIGVRHFHNIAVPITAVGEEDTIQLVTREITLEKRNEQELEQKTKKLAMINRIVRHDINNDVQLLRGWAKIVNDHVDEAERETVERIADTSDHIAELTEIARDFIESLEDDSAIDLDRVELDRTLRAEIDKKRTTHTEAKFIVDDLPVVSVRANELLASVFGNLLSNAIRHNDVPTPEVTVTLRETEQAVITSVADNGPGVPDARKEEIFGKGSMGPKSPGTGIGLHLVHTLVGQYGGEVWVEDNEPRGTVFNVKLPKIPDR